MTKTSAGSGPPAGPSDAFTRRADGVFLVAAALGPLTLYVLTMPRTVMLEDDGLFLMAGAHLGIAHPPGYPLHTLLVHLFMQLPFGSPAVLGHLSSAVTGALACGAVYACARLLHAGRLPALAAAWLFGASEHAWSQAIITEVYSLQSLIFFVLWALLLHGVRNPGRQRPWVAAAVCYGIGIANHWPLLALATPGLVLLAAPAWRAVLPRLPRLAGLGAASAVLPYLWMVWRSQQNPVISFYGPINNLRELWFYVSRQGYAHVDISQSAGWSDRLAFLQWFGHEAVWQLTPLGFVLAALGLVAQYRRGKLVAAGAGVAVFLCQSVILVMLLGFDFDPYHVAVFRPYSLVCYGLLALWAALGLQTLTEWVAGRLPTRVPAWLPPAAVAATSLVLVAAQVHTHWRFNDRSGSDLTRRYADVLFEQVEDDAVVLTFDDVSTGVLGYYHFVENELPNGVMLNQQGLVFSNRLYSFRRRKEDRRAILSAYIADAGRPIVAFSGDSLPQCSGCGYRSSGFVTEIVPGAGSDALQLTLNPESERYFRYLLAQDFVDSWEYTTSRNHLRGYGQFLGEFLDSGLPELLDRVRPLVVLAESNYHCLMGMIATLLGSGNPAAHLERVQDWLARAKQLRDPARMTKKEKAEFAYVRGFVRHLVGDQKAAITLFRQGVEAHDHPENPAKAALRQLGVQD